MRSPLGQGRLLPVLLVKVDQAGRLFGQREFHKILPGTSGLTELSWPLTSLSLPS